MFKIRYSYTARDSALLVLFIMAVSVVYSFLFSLIVTKIALSNGAKTQEEIMAFASLPWVNVINMFLGQVFSFGTYFIYSVVNGKKTFDASTVKGKIRLYPILVTMLITAVCVFGFNYMITLVDYSIFSLTKIEVAATAIPEGFGGYIVVVIAFAIIPGIVEEFIYRGVVFNGLKRSMKPVYAILLSALIFTLIHLGIYQFVYQFIMGVILACLAYYTGSILYSMIFHVTNNFLVVTLSYFAPQIFSISNMSAGIVTLVLFGAIATAGVIVGLIILLKNLIKKYPTAAEVKEEKSEQDQLIENSEGLSEYDIRQLNPPKMKDKTLVIILVSVLIVLWFATVLA